MSNKDKILVAIAIIICIIVILTGVVTIFRPTGLTTQESLGTVVGKQINDFNKAVNGK